MEKEVKFWVGSYSNGSAGYLETRLKAEEYLKYKNDETYELIEVDEDEFPQDCGWTYGHIYHIFRKK